MPKASARTIRRRITSLLLVSVFILFAVFVSGIQKDPHLVTMNDPRVSSLVQKYEDYLLHQKNADIDKTPTPPSDTPPFKTETQQPVVSPQEQPEPPPPVSPSPAVVPPQPSENNSPTSIPEPSNPTSPRVFGYIEGDNISYIRASDEYWVLKLFVVSFLSFA